MKRRWFIVILASALTLTIAVVCLGAGGTWVGSTDLEVVLVVVDAETGKPIEGALITIQSFGGFYSKEDKLRDREPFTLRTDDRGEARRTCHGMMCSGRYGYWGLGDTIASHQPNWLLDVLAPGYHPKHEWLETFDSKLERTGRRPVHSFIRIPLRSI